MAVSNNAALSQHTSDCSNSCSALFLNEFVTVIREHLHMLKAGISMTNSQSRDNQVVRVAEVQFWDFDQQGNLGVVQAPFTIQAGDSFRTTCNYNVKNGEVFGFGSTQEMCITFLFYYPRKVISSDYGDIPFMCGPNAFDDVLYRPRGFVGTEKDLWSCRVMSQTYSCELPILLREGTRGTISSCFASY